MSLNFLKIFLNLISKLDFWRYFYYRDLLRETSPCLIRRCLSLWDVMQCSTQQKRLWGLTFSKCDLGPFSQRNLNTWWLCKFSGAYFIRDWRKLCLLQDVVRWSRMFDLSPSCMNIQQQLRERIVSFFYQLRYTIASYVDLSCSQRLPGGKSAW